MHPDVAKKQREIQRLRDAGHTATSPAVQKAQRELARLKAATK